jgi:hypothetical protein
MGHPATATAVADPYGMTTKKGNRTATADPYGMTTKKGNGNSNGKSLRDDNQKGNSNGNCRSASRVYFLPKTSPMRRIWAPTPRSFSSKCS